MAEAITESPLPTGTDYSFINYERLNGFCYMTQAFAGLMLNMLVIATVFKSQRMRRAPKYWLVLIVSAAYLVQAAFSNPQMIVAWFQGQGEHSCKVWVVAVAYNTYICVGITCWCSFLINMDYFFCLMSVKYRQRQRASVIMCFLFMSILILIASMVAVTIFFGSTSRPFNEVACHFSISNIMVGEALLKYTVYFPLIGSIVFVLLSVCFRKKGTMESLLQSDQLNLTASLNVQGYGGSSRMPPLDHVCFLIILIVFYIPATLMSQLAASRRLSPHEHQENALYVNVSTASAVMRDNAGPLAALSWYWFSDMRYTLMQLPCCKRKSQPSDFAFVESSEFRAYYTYPYCDSRERSLL
ncbi:hypothetical protein ElyMa_003435400 [Elysia marginata]|uniref:G-protein coupled receptors family 1 profile domain-containing protein n=1 Tax=Elysia marginata TaxID=1093978 RepID=A0AAV4JQZ2_9GAST|nr:hypothetical protein ElyMa_003435400 [Elysia marginata]